MFLICLHANLLYEMLLIQGSAGTHSEGVDAGPHTVWALWQHRELCVIRMFIFAIITVIRAE